MISQVGVGRQRRHVVEHGGGAADVGGFGHVGGASDAETAHAERQPDLPSGSREVACVVRVEVERLGDDRHERRVEFLGFFREQLRAHHASPVHELWRDALAEQQEAALEVLESADILHLLNEIGDLALHEPLDVTALAAERCSEYDGALDGVLRGPRR